MVAHFHYVVFGTVVFAMFAGFYVWWSKITGRILDATLGKIHFWMLFIGFHLTFLVQRWLGAEGLPRRYADYRVGDGFTTLNTVSTIGAFLFGMSTLPFILSVIQSRRNPKIEVHDPLGWGRSLEWATSCLPPRHNFTSMPRVRSESPAFDMRHAGAAAPSADSGRAAEVTTQVIMVIAAAPLAVAATLWRGRADRGAWSQQRAGGRLGRYDQVMRHLALVVAVLGVVGVLGSACGRPSPAGGSSRPSRPGWPRCPRWPG